MPGKNIKLLGGIPLIAHSIIRAKETAFVERIYVSTDSDEIAAVAKDYHAEVIIRPQELATDTASEWLAWRHAVNYLEKAGVAFDIFLSLPSTSPLRASLDIENCVNALADDTDMVVTVTPSSRSPYFNMVTRDHDGFSELVIDSGGLTRRQDAPITYDLTTVAYVTRPKFIKSNQGLFSGRVKSVIVPKERAVDIDDAHDFLFAEALYERGKK